MRTLALTVVAVLLAGLRAAGHRSPAFQAAAHLYVGGLAAAWWCGRGRLPLWLAGGLTAAEVACFLFLPR